MLPLLQGSPAPPQRVLPAPGVGRTVPALGAVNLYRISWVPVRTDADHSRPRAFGRMRTGRGEPAGARQLGYRCTI